MSYNNQKLSTQFICYYEQSFVLNIITGRINQNLQQVNNNNNKRKDSKQNYYFCVFNVIQVESYFSLCDAVVLNVCRNS